MEKNSVKVGIMQPYFMPYIGYWQLMNAVDKYVIYDDVNFIKRGWIHRNRILINGEPRYINIPMLGVSQNKLINEIEVNQAELSTGKTLRSIEEAYKRAPYYDAVFPLMKEILNCGRENIASFIEFSFQIICEYLDIQTELIVSSKLDKNCELKGQDKILDVCSRLNATEYYNAIGGQELYSFEAFEERGMKLSFLKTDQIEYPQYGNEFQANLSMIDVLMFNSKEQVQDMLKRFELITSENGGSKLE